MRLSGRFDCPAPRCEWSWTVGELSELEPMLRALASPSQVHSVRIAREHLALGKAFDDHVRADHTSNALMIELLRLHNETLPSHLSLRTRLLGLLQVPMDVRNSRWAGSVDGAPPPPKPDDYF